MPHFDVVFWVDTRSPDVPQFPVYRVVNLSRLGALIGGLHPEGVHPGDTMEGLIVLPSRAFKVAAKIVRLDAQGLAFDFVDPDEEFCNYLGGFLGDMRIGRMFQLISAEHLSVQMKEENCHVLCYLMDGSQGGLTIWQDKVSGEVARFDFDFQNKMLEWTRQDGLRFYHITQYSGGGGHIGIKGSDLLEPQDILDKNFVRQVSSVVGAIPSLHQEIVVAIRERLQSGLSGK